MPTLDINEIRGILPHRFPFLLVDRIIEMEPDRIVGIKNVTANEPHFMGHFPEFPVMPGVLIVEAMAQVDAVGLLASLPNRERKVIYLTGIDRCKFRRPVVPGDQLLIEVEMVTIKTRMSKCRTVAKVNGALCAEAELLSTILERP